MVALNGWPALSVSAWPVAAPADGTMPTSAATELGTRATKLSITRGRQYEMDKDQAGTLQLDVRDDDGLFTNGTTFQPLMPVQVSATLNGTTHKLFTGYWESLPWQNPTPLEGTAQLSAQDVLGAWSNRTLSSTMTESIMAASTAPDLYMPLASLNPLVGVSGNAALYTSGQVASGFNGSFAGDSAFQWNLSDKAAVAGRVNSTGGTTFPPSTTWWATIGFTVSSNGSTDVIPILSLLDMAGNPAYLLYAKTGQLHFQAYTGTNRTAASASYEEVVSSSTLAAGEHVVTVGHTGGTAYLAVDGSWLMVHTYGGWVPYTVTQYAVGIPVSITGTSPSWAGWAASSAPDGTAWSASQAVSFYGLALYVGTSQPDNSWAPAIQQEATSAAVPVSTMYSAAQGWSGFATWDWDSDSTQVVRKAPTGSSMAQFLQDYTDSTQGRLYIAPDGTPRIRSRDVYQFRAAYTWTFGGTGGGSIPSAALTPSAGLYPGTYYYPYTGSPQFAYDLTRVYTDVTVTSASYTGWAPKMGVQQAQRRVLSVQSQAVDATSQAQWLLGRYSSPHPRPAVLTFEPGANPDLWPMVLGIDLDDHVQLVHKVAGQPDVTMDGFVESIAHEIDATAGTWRTTVQISPNLGSYWVLGDSTYSVLGSTTTPGWRTS